MEKIKKLMSLLCLRELLKKIKIIRLRRYWVSSIRFGNGEGSLGHRVRTTEKGVSVRFLEQETKSPLLLRDIKD